MAVKEIKDAEFIAHLKQHEKVIMRFYADWCGSCRLFEPKYKELSGEGKYQEVSFVDVNAEENPESRQAVKVDNLPYFVAFKNGKLVDKENTTKKERLEALLEKLN